MQTVYKAINGNLNKNQEINLEVVASIISRKDTLVRTKVESETKFKLTFKKGQINFVFANSKWIILGTETLITNIDVDTRNDLSIYMGAKVQII